MYHSVQDEPTRYANSIGTGIIHPTSMFTRQMELVSTRFNPVTIEEIRVFLNGGKPLPPRAVAVTFDDGYVDNSEVVAPILQRFGVRAAFYLTAALIGTKNPPWFCRLRHAFATVRKKQWILLTNRHPQCLTTAQDKNTALLTAFDLCASLAGDVLEQTVQTIEHGLDIEPLVTVSGLMMDWNQARSLQRAGHIVGCHTLTHPNVAHVAEGVARKELTISKRKLEDELGVPVLHFSYPHPALNPQWTRRTVAISKEAGYQTAVTTTPGVVRKGDDPHILTRIWTPRSEHEFMWNLECAFLRRHAQSAA
ncbi:MAG TPA: polysaccharide deacetylase family protein [Terriglobales bacterium]|jgi:peptidoglycan/xylan/chitin deacetylase (PgdA/CDA1 family)|nr:polysaccharide deacetylase family protein [Terriglobales bacterium]